MRNVFIVFCVRFLMVGLFTIIIILGIFVVIWIFFEIKKFKFKFFVVFLILLILFFYFGASVALKGQDVNFKSVDGIKHAGGLFFSWVSSMFSNVKTLSGHAVNLDWSATSEKNETFGDN